MVDQEVLVADLVEDRLGSSSARHSCAARTAGPSAAGRCSRVSCAPVAEAQAIRACARRRPRSTSKFSTRMFSTRARHVGLDLRAATARRSRSCFRLRSTRLEQVVGLVLLDHHVGVADDAEQVRAVDLRAREQLLDVGADDVFEEREGQAARAARSLSGSGDEARQHVRHLDARELGAPAVPHDDREVLAQVRDERERMPGVERQRRQDREDVAREVAVRGTRRSPACTSAASRKWICSGCEQRPQQLGPARRDLRRASCVARAARIGVELLLGVQAVRRDVLDRRRGASSAASPRAP